MIQRLWKQLSLDIPHLHLLLRLGRGIAL